MLHKSGYNYPKNAEATVGAGLVSGKGLLWASGMYHSLPNFRRNADMNHPGHVHQRQRKLMSPAFTAPQLKSFLPLFRRISGKVGVSGSYYS